MLSTRLCEGIGSEDLEVVVNLVDTFGRYAEGLFEFCDFGFPSSVIRSHLGQLSQDLQTIRRGTCNDVHLSPRTLPSSSRLVGEGPTVDYGQTLRFAAGTAMITENLRGRMDSAGRRRAILAKILHQCQAGILDDLIDQAPYTFAEARNLYHHCLVANTDFSFRPDTYRRGLVSMLKQPQAQAVDLLTNITEAFNRQYCQSPRGPDLFHEIQRIDSQVGLGQSLAMLQKSPSIDLPDLERICSGFWSPDPDVAWHERLSSYMAGVTQYNLIDMCMLREAASPSEISAMKKAWYYFDIVISRLNHVTKIERDLRAGTLNLALVAMREREVSVLRTVQGFDPVLTAWDYGGHFARTAELARRALDYALRGADRRSMFYPFISVMIPVVMLADWIRDRDPRIKTFLRDIAKSIRESPAGAHGTSLLAETLEAQAK